MKAANVLATIGGTPHIRVNRLFGSGTEVWVKSERSNPGGSIKDRIALSMVEDAEARGLLQAGGTIIEPTSGNTGIGLAIVAAVKGYTLVLVMPDSMSVERRRLMLAYGAKFVLTPREKGMKGAIEAAKRAMEDHGEDAFMPSQFDNAANVQIHRETTAFEIWKDTEGKADILISGVGTGGTLTGVSQILKQHKPEFKTYAVEPEESPVISGGEPGPHKIQGIGAGFVPSILDKSLIDGIVKINSQTALDTAREVARLEGILCGISSGAVFAAAKAVAGMPESKGKQIVVIVPSFSERYISTALFDNLD